MPDIESPTGSWQPSERVGAIATRVFQFLLLLTVVCAFLPLLPSMPRASADASWQFGLNQAVAQGLAFGRDVVFTYGPFAAVYLKNYHPATDHLMLSGGLYLALLYGLAILLVVRDARWYLPVAAMVAFSSTTYMHSALYFSYPLLVGLFCFRLVESCQGAVFGESRAAVFLLLLFSGFGLLSLVKGSFIPLCTSVTALAGGLFLCSRKWLWMFAVVASTGVSLPVFWLLSGQSAADLPAYFQSAAWVVSGYSDAMSKEGSLREVALFILVTGCLLFLLLVRGSSNGLHRLYVAGLFFVFLFLGFKAGFVRHGWNAAASATSLLIAAGLYAIVFRTRWSVAVLLSAALAWVYIDRNARHSSVETIVHEMASVYAQAWKGLRDRVRGGPRLNARYRNRLSELGDTVDFPVFEGTTDIYSYNQSYLIASGNDWNPRPVMQSYAAYTPVLAQKNADHLLGDEAPDNLVFRVEPIDRRLPSSEDGPSWPVILGQYRPAALKNGFLYLERESGLLQTATPLGKAMYAFGEAVPVPAAHPLVFAEVSIRKTLPGRLASFLFKAGELQISLQLADGNNRVFRIVPGMAEAGFLVSPLVESTNQFARLFGDPERLSDKRVQSFTLSTTGSTALWQDNFEVRLLSPALTPPADILSLYRFDSALQEPEAFTVETAEECEGNIDAINGSSPPPEQVSATDILAVRGWLAASPSEGRVPESVLLALRGVNGERTFVTMRRKPHAWAARKFGKPAMAMSGYTVIADISALSGSYELGLAYREGDRIRVCPQFAVPLRLGVVDR